VTTTVASTVAALASAALLWRLPTSLDGTLRTAVLWVPDTGWALLSALALALLLAVTRTVAGIVDLRRPHRHVRPDEA
jgi:hypothetical protein